MYECSQCGKKQRKPYFTFAPLPPWQESALHCCSYDCVARRIDMPLVTMLKELAEKEEPDPEEPRTAFAYAITIGKRMHTWSPALGGTGEARVPREAGG